MKAIVYTQYGPPEVLQLKEMEKPTPKEKEILIRVRATSVNFGDMMARNFKAFTPRTFNMPFLFWFIAKISFGLNEPKKTILGSEFSGEIEAVGKEVKRFKKGDQVFGFPAQNFGAYAEYFCMAENGVLTIKPENITHEEAAVVSYGSSIASGLLRNMNIKPGQKILINGASGSIGSAAVQIAKHYGAKVTGVCGTPRLKYVIALGADKVIDYTKEDFTKNGETYDLIFDILGKSSFSQCQNSLKEKGILLYASFKMKQVFQMLLTSRTNGKKVICKIGPGGIEDLNFVRDLIAAGKIKTIIDKRFPLEQTAAAHRYVEEGKKQGNVVITVRYDN